MRKFLKVFFSLAVTIYFSTTMFYCFVSISGKNWINRANNQVLWYDKEKQRMDETGQLCIIIERKTVTVRKTLM